MSFVVMEPDPNKRVEMAIEDIRAGRMVILVDDEDRENEGDLTMAAAAVTPEAINFMATHGRGLICLTLTEERVGQLSLPMMAAQNQSPYETAFTVSIEAREGVTTGISAADRAHTIQVAIDPTKNAGDIVVPGHIFPLRARNGGTLVRTGQTEGSVDLARLAGLPPYGVICEIMNEDGTMARLPDLERFGAEHNIRIVAVADIIRWRLRHETLVQSELEAPVNIPGFGMFKSRVYRELTGSGIHLALYRGDIDDGEPVITRVQSYNPAGDVFGAMSCDTRLQLEGALGMIADADRGVFLYMHIGGEDTDSLISRIKNSLQPSKEEPEEPTVTSQGRGLRHLGVGAQILLDLGVSRMKLVTNNPRKIVGLEGYGLDVVERVPLHVPVNADNETFLRTRRLQLGHLLPDVEA
ncbi:MAG: 3,4-dihydroxy-2-butanone-4-phosphate synthase [Myxococcota bacterium]